MNLLVIDGGHLLWRSCAAFPMLSVDVDGDDVPTGGIHGFLTVLAATWQRVPGTTVVAWDGRTKRNFRYEIWAAYKRRDKDDDEDKRAEVYDQRERLARILSAMGVRQYESVGCEADDVIGRLALVAKPGRHVTIYSGDSDLLQLVGSDVSVLLPKGQRLRPKDVLNNKGVAPSQIADMKALAGDPSDGIPGVPGIGPVAAVKLLAHYEEVERVLVAAIEGDESWPLSDAKRQAVAEHARMVRVFHDLTRIRVDREWKAIPRQRDKRALINELRRYGLRSLAMPFEVSSLMRFGGASK